MTRRRPAACLLAICLLLLLIAAPSAAEAPGSRTITVFAAASLTDALTQLSKRYEESGGDSVRMAFAASSTLARQVEAGAPADIFISANVQWMDYLADRGLIAPETRISPVGNTLVMIAPAGSTIGPVDIAADMDVAALLRPGARLAIGDPAHVPAGIYAKQAFQALRLWDAVDPLAARSDSVRAALALVERGEAPLGVVYATDAAASSRVRLVGRFPPNTYPTIRYPYAIIAGRDSPPVRRFFDFVTGGASADVYEQLGFLWTGPTG